MRPTRVHAFTLVELLVVMAIMAILIGLASGVMRGVAGGQQLRAAAESAVSLFDLARQNAVALNSEVEIRIYRTSAAGGAREFRAMQAFAYLPDGGVKPLGRVESLPTGFAIASSRELSSLLAPSREKSWSNETKPPIPTFGTGYDAWAFRFLPDGSAGLDASAGQWFLTIVRSPNADATTPPPNFITIQVDPINGNIRTFQP